MKTNLSIAVAVLCGSAFAQHTVSLNLQGFSPHVGQMFKARMVEMPSEKQVAETTFTALPGPAATLVFMGESGKSYTIDYFADMNGDRAYSAPPADHAWRKEAGPLHHQGIVINAAHDVNFTDIRYPNGPAGIRLVNPLPGQSDSRKSRLQVVLQPGRSAAGVIPLNLLGRVARSSSGVQVLGTFLPGSP